MPERVTFATEDGVTIAGERYAGPSIDGPSALLLHMMPATKESWRPFAEALVARGFSHVLAIDLRGHGESTAGPGGSKLFYKDFSDEEQQAKMKDVEAAVAWLEGMGVRKDRLLLAGASIGANLAIAYAAAYHEIPAVIALSPGLDYRGVTTGDKISALADHQRVHIAASTEDEYSFASMRSLASRRPGSTISELHDAGHGTTMFEREPVFMAETLAWAQAAMRP